MRSALFEHCAVVVFFADPTAKKANVGLDDLISYVRRLHTDHSR
jgi:hypothetical protein